MIPYANEDKQAEAESSANNYGAPNHKVKWHHSILLNRPAKVLAAGVVLAVVTPMFIYNFLFFPSEDLPPADGFTTGSCLLPRSSRIPCGIGNISDTQCHSQCCYDNELNLCFHRHPSRFTYIVEGVWTENKTLTPRIDTVPYKKQNSVKIQLSIDEITATHVAVTFYDPNNMTVEGRRIAEKNYTWEVSTPELNIVVNDKRGHEMFNTIRGPIIASDNIWEIAFKTTETAMFGFGEIPIVEGTVKVLYHHDGSSNDVPLIFSKTGDTYHGLLIDISEPTEVRFESENQIVVRSITNRGMRFHLFTGPEPKDIMRGVLSITGFRNELEYWMLGVHICSDISTPTDTTAYDDFVAFTTQAATEKLPYDSHCGVAPVKFYDDCQITEHRDDVVRGMEVVKNRKKRFVPHVSPYIFYKEPVEDTEDNSTETIKPRREDHLNCSNIVTLFENNLLKTAESDLYKGLVNNKTVLYPDYDTVPEDFMEKLWGGPEFDGIVLENTWPLDESLKNHIETSLELPYFNENFAAAFNNTPQWDIKRPNNTTYMYTHNQYGNHFAKAFRRTSEKFIPVYTTTQWMAGEIVNRQNIDATWTNLQKQLTEAAIAGISGNWLWSSPICGDTKHFNDTTQAQLCVKWYMAATFFPLVKIHSKETPRHPLAFSGTNKANIIRGINYRYSLLPYFYTTLQKGPLLRPMFYQFPFSKNITTLKTQFSVGDDLLIVPNLQPSQIVVHVQMPPGHWYEFLGGLALEAEEGETITMATTEADFLTLIRGGAIVVMQKDSRETAEETRLSSSYYLTVALDCKVVNTTGENAQNITNCHAEGELFMTENMTIIFEANSEKLTIRAVGDDFATFCDFQNAIWSQTLKEINVFGLEERYNNYDSFRNVAVWSDLCQLQTQQEIVLNIV